MYYYALCFDLAFCQGAFNRAILYCIVPMFKAGSVLSKNSHHVLDRDTYIDICWTST